MSVKYLALVIVAVGIALTTVPASATNTLFFVGGNDNNNYNNADNWDLGRVPTNRDFAYVVGPAANVWSPVVGPSQLYVGYYIAGGGQLNLLPGAAFTPSTVDVGVNGNSMQGAKGTIVQTGGTMTTNFVGLGSALLPEYDGGTGTYTISGGLLNLGAHGGKLYVGVEGYGTLTQSGGTVTMDNGCSIGTQGSLVVSGGEFSCVSTTGSFATFGVSGTVSQTGGVIRTSGSEPVGGLYTISGLDSSLTVDGALNVGLGTSITAGTFTQDGGAVTVGHLYVAQTAHTGTYNLNGGELNVNGASVVEKNGTLNVRGGTLKLAYNSITYDPNEFVGSGTINVSGGTVQNVGNISTYINLPSGGTATFFQGVSPDGKITAGTLSGAISGDGNLVKSAFGTLYLSGANTYTGLTTVQRGALVAANAGALPGMNAPGKIVVNSGGAVGGRTSGGTVSAFTEASFATLRNNVAWAATGASLAIDTTNGDYIYGSALTNPDGSHSIGLTKLGVNTLTLAGSNTYSGATTVSAGALVAANTGALPNWNTPGKIVISNGGAVGGRTSGGTIAGFTEANFVTLRNSANWVASGASLAIDTTNGNYTYATALTNPSGRSIGLLKLGGNTLTLGAANSYTGTTTVNTGTLAYGVSNAIFTGAVNVNGGVLSLGAFSDTVGAVTLTSGSISSTTGTLTSTSGFEVQSGTASANLAGGVGLTKTTSGTVVFSGVNSYTGTTTVSAGVLLGATTAALPNWNTSGKIIISNGGAVGGRTGGGTVTGFTEADFATLRSKAAWAASGGSLAIDTTNGNYTFASALINPDASHSIGLVKVGSNTLTLSAANTYTGPTTVSGGTLQIGDGTTNASIAGNSIINNAALVMNVVTSIPEYSYSGSITGSGSFTKLGPGAMTLYGYSGYTGNTTVSAGSLTISGPSLMTLGNAGVSPKFLGTGSLNLNGILGFDINGVTETSGTWHVVNVASLTESYGDYFTVYGISGLYTVDEFTRTGNLFTYTDYLNRPWTFDELTGNLTLGTGVTYLQGDANTDGTVNSNDLGLLLTHYNQTIPIGTDGWAWGDFNADSTVNSNDLGLLLTHYNQVSQATSAVPEPSTLLLAAAGLISLLAYAWRKRK